jgi:hypothetical protein
MKNKLSTTPLFVKWYAAFSYSILGGFGQGLAYMAQMQEQFVTWAWVDPYTY